MNKLYKPTIGPLLGHREYFEGSVLQRALVRANNTKAKQTCYFFVREVDGDFEEIYSEVLRDGTYDYTAIIELKDLPLDTKFEYKVVIARGEKRLPEYDLLKDKECYRGNFETKNRNDTITSFVFGSCCHFSLVGINQADDAAFKSMLGQWGQGIAQDDFILMLGDQIYGDHGAGKSILSDIPGFRVGMLFIPVKFKSLLNFGHYINHYYKAFRKKNKRKIMATIPTYMIFDDHEVHNDWGSNKFLKKTKDYKVLRDGLRAYNIYQVSHPDIVAPTIAVPKKNQIKRGYDLPEAKYYYQYSHGKSGFFVMDTRFNKIPLNEEATNSQQTRMISPIQMRALKSFLKDKSTSIKFVATSVPMAPDSKSDGKCLTKKFDNSPEDRWEGHAIQRKLILDFINKKNIKNVIFLSGDVHVSYAFKLVATESARVIAYQITSSAFNWGIGLNDCHFGKTKPLKGTDGMYKPVNLTGDFITKDNFCRIVVKTNKADVCFYHAKTGKNMRSFSIPLESDKPV